MSRIADFFLEALRNRDLSDDESARLRARIAANPAESERLRALDDDDRAILAALPADPFAAEVHRRNRAIAVPRGSAAGARARAVSALGLVAAFAIVVVVVRAREPGPSDASAVPSTNAGERAKGDRRIALEVHRVGKDGGVDDLGDGSKAARGDTLQLAFRAPGHRYGVILSLDGRGRVTLHQPEDVHGGSELPDDASGAGRVALPHSYELDDAPYFERFVFVAADRPLDVAAVVARAERVAADPCARSEPLAVVGAVDEQSITLAKVSP